MVLSKEEGCPRTERERGRKRESESESEREREKAIDKTNIFITAS